MIRWVNDYNIIDRIYKGYKPTIPLKIKDVGGGRQSLEMEMADIDYKHHQVNKQIENDKRTIGSGKDLERHKRDIEAEFMDFVVSKVTTTQLFNLYIRKLFNFNVSKYINTFFKERT